MSKYILLATYNGAAFLPEQMESILSQTDGWELLVRDDGSSDGTQELIRNRVAGGAPIIFIDEGQSRLGARGNFARLLEIAWEKGADYCALSDQDDLWLPSKLAEQLNQIKLLEQKFPHCPILIHSDLEVVNQNLDIINPSFMSYQKIHHESSNPLNILLCQNFVTGSTVMINRPLLELALPVPGEALMHDWWLALCAAAFGRLEYCAEPLVKYRQHTNNAIGAKNLRQLMNPLKNNWPSHWSSGCDNLAGSMLQARALADRIRKHDPENSLLHLIEEYASLMELPSLNRIKTLKKSGIHMQSSLRHMLMISRLPFSRGC
jgi:glycosyltransferase involved in cell wall biosynthesis